ncbi:MAG: lytic transglycosylase domain-containing protein [Alphaproteobacteria bacterium]|nr:lytic transglycosylase domain-containing protein [Alphaproteobacteria bacterium]
MASMSAAVVCILCAAQPMKAPTVVQWQPIIARASVRFGVPEDWIAAVMGAESGGRTTLNGEPITSVAGAMGLMQLMPGTFADMRRQYELGPDPYDPRTNIMAGTAYLRTMFERYGYPDLFAAYYAGPGRFEAFLRHGWSLPKATLAYVNRIIPGGVAARDLAVAKQDNANLPLRKPSTSPLFFMLESTHAIVNPAPSAPQNNNGLFVPLSKPAW